MSIFVLLSSLPAQPCSLSKYYFILVMFSAIKLFIARLKALYEMAAVSAMVAEAIDQLLIQF